MQRLNTLDIIIAYIQNKKHNFVSRSDQEQSLYAHAIAEGKKTAKNIAFQFFKVSCQELREDFFKCYQYIFRATVTSLSDAQTLKSSSNSPYHQSHSLDSHPCPSQFHHHHSQSSHSGHSHSSQCQWHQWQQVQNLNSLHHIHWILHHHHPILLRHQSKHHPLQMRTRIPILKLQERVSCSDHGNNFSKKYISFNCNLVLKVYILINNLSTSKCYRLFQLIISLSSHNQNLVLLSRAIKLTGRFYKSLIVVFPQYS